MKKTALCSICIIICIILLVPISATRDLKAENSMALDLKELGLFNGVSETDFDLDRAPTRTEVLVMLIRVLGVEDTALNGSWKHPFTDVPQWADKYIGYAYENGLTQGISKTKFGVGTASAQTYLTFMLRALGYSDTNNLDFSWDKPYDLAKKVGILPDMVNTEDFWRADIVTISYAALGANLKDSTKTLGEKLIESEAFTTEAFREYYRPSKLQAASNNVETSLNVSSRKELNASEIYEKCAYAVFYIEIYDEYSRLLGSGSGFFITQSGIAVTNHHVIENASSAKIMTSHDNAVYDVIGVYDSDKGGDWAVLQIDGSGFNTLEMCTEPVSVGDDIFTIGSPKGFDDTISTGIISNASRMMNGYEYIQISAPISHGSSGGALLNKYGEVIGITSAGIDEGQNLNFARPISCILEADLDNYVKLGDTAVQQALTVEYYVSDNNVVLNKGDSATIDFEYAISNADDEVVTFYIKSLDESIATVEWGPEEDLPWSIIINGLSEGQTTLNIYNDHTTDVTNVLINVVSSGSSNNEVIYYPESDSITAFANRETRFKISMDDPGVEITYTVESDNPYIADVEWDMEIDEYPWEVIITGNVPGKTNIRFTNDYNDATLVIPVEVCDPKDVYVDYLKYLVIENGDYDSEDCLYSLGSMDDENVDYFALMYYEDTDEFYMASLVDFEDTEDVISMITLDSVMPVEALLIWGDDMGLYHIDPKTYSGSETFYFDDFSGSRQAKAELEELIGDFTAYTLIGCDQYLLSEYGITLADLGYENFIA